MLVEAMTSSSNVYIGQGIGEDLLQEVITYGLGTYAGNVGGFSGSNNIVKW